MTRGHRQRATRGDRDGEQVVGDGEGRRREERQSGVHRVAAAGLHQQEPGEPGDGDHERGADGAAGAAPVTAVDQAGDQSRHHGRHLVAQSKDTGRVDDGATRTRRTSMAAPSSRNTWRQSSVVSSAPAPKASAAGPARARSPSSYGQRRPFSGAG